MGRDDESTENEATTGEAGAGARDASRSEGSPPVGDALTVLVQAVLTRGRSGLERWAQQGRHRMELRQLRRDRDVMLQKLGREARALIEGGEIDHPGLRRGIARLEELEAQIATHSERGTAVGPATATEE